MSNVENELALLNEATTESWEIPDNLVSGLVANGFPFKSSGLKEFVVNSSSQYFVLKFAVKCFNQFLQANWTGPALGNPCFQLKETPELVSALSVDGEEVYSGCLHKELLVGTITLLDILSELPGFQTIPIWRSRAYFVWQRVLADANDRGQGNCPSLISVCLNEFVESVSDFLSIEITDHLESVLFSTKSPSNPNRLPSVSSALQSELSLELVVRLLYYGKLDSVRMLLDHVSTLLGVRIDVTGVEGVKRQYQTVAFAQMAARVICSNKEVEEKIFNSESVMPASLLLSSYDVTTDILEQVSCESSVTNPEELTSPLSALEQCLLVVEALRYWYSGNSRDELNLESVHALGVRIIAGHQKQIGVWTPFSASLLLRSRSEFFKNSTRGRACFQTDTLVAQFADPQPLLRLAYLHATGYPSLWELQRENGTRMMEVGMVVTACEMFKQLQMWPLVMDCLAVAGRKSEALDLLAELEKDRILSPRLLCSKGDMTGDAQYYHLAWESSGKRNARAQRSLGRLAMKIKDFKTAADCFELSLEINPLFDEIWFSLGSIYLQSEEDEKAVNAFVRCVGINPEHVQAWVNLSAVYQRFPDRLGEAKNAAAEAVKLSPQAWQFWDNFVLICARLGDWQSVIKGELKLSVGPLARKDRPDLNLVELLCRQPEMQTRKVDLLETLVLNNKQSPRLLALLAEQYTAMGFSEKAMKTRTFELKELLSACTSEASQQHFDALQVCLLEVSRFISEGKAMGLTSGLGLTVRSIPRRVVAANGGKTLPNLEELCHRIESQLRQKDTISE